MDAADCITAWFQVKLVQNWVMEFNSPRAFGPSFCEDKRLSSNALNALYYPFSRTKDITSLKQFLLLYDKTVFLDPVSDEEWRAHLFSNLEAGYDGFSSYADLSDNFPHLISEGVVEIVDPSKITALDSKLTTAGILSDLADANWLRLCNPLRAAISCELDSETGEPFWQMFKQKIPNGLLELTLKDEFLQKHFLQDGGDRYAWHLSYAAGSAIALNVHMAASEELGMNLVSDSPLHNQLLLAKATRSEGSTAAPFDGNGQANQLTNRAMLKILDSVLPADALEMVSVEEILRFREGSERLRRDFAKEIESLVQGHDSLHESRQIYIPNDLARRFGEDLRSYGNELASIRDTIWPRLLGSFVAGAPVATSAAGLAASYISGSGYVLAASLMAHALSPIKTALEIEAERKEVRRSPSSALA
ncbi:hypothetical protein JMM59_10270, partial [Rhodovulum sulfidophilum]|uniref:hypothetical protein n=1 Tax=Rhodovulum sulfidophilum TaxID=35806 RepID=UPI0019213C29